MGQPSRKVAAIREMARRERESMSDDEAERRQQRTERELESHYRGQADKIRENRLRRMAARQGLRLEKSRRRDPRALDYGTYWLVRGPAPSEGNWRSRELVTSEHGMSLDEIAEFLTSDDEQRQGALRRMGE